MDGFCMDSIFKRVLWEDILCWIIRAVDVHAGIKAVLEPLSSSFFLPTIVREHALLSESFKRDADVYDFKRIFRLAQEGDEDALLIRNECMDIWRQR